MQVRGIHAYRLAPDQKNPREVAFAEEWDKEHDETSRSAILPNLLYPKLFDPFVPMLFSPADKSFEAKNLWIKRRAYPSHRDHVVAATVIQWLGSNVGFSFLQAALSKCGYEIVRKKEQR